MKRTATSTDAALRLIGPAIANYLSCVRLQSLFPSHPRAIGDFVEHLCLPYISGNCDFSLIFVRMYIKPQAADSVKGTVSSEGTKTKGSRTATDSAEILPRSPSNPQIMIAQKVSSQRYLLCFPCVLLCIAYGKHDTACTLVVWFKSKHEGW